MYYIEVLEIIKKAGEWLSSTEILILYQEQYNEGNRLNLNKALSKLRRRTDIDWELKGRTYFYRYVKPQ